MRANEDIRRAIGARGLKQWEVADKLGMLDCSFSRKLRKELDPEEKEKIFTAINELSEEVCG